MKRWQLLALLSLFGTGARLCARREDINSEWRSFISRKHRFESGAVRRVMNEREFTRGKCRADWHVFILIFSDVLSTQRSSLLNEARDMACVTHLLPKPRTAINTRPQFQISS